MSIISSLERLVAQVATDLYGTTPTAGQIQLQKTRSEFEGQWTLVTFPLLKLSRKSPEVTAQEIGERLLQHPELVCGIQIVKGFLNQAPG